MKLFADDNFNMFVEENIKDGRRVEVLNELKVNVKKLEKPRNVLLLGSLGTGKSSFINTVITALTGRYKPYADIGCGSKHNSTRLHKYGITLLTLEVGKRIHIFIIVSTIALQTIQKRKYQRQCS